VHARSGSIRGRADVTGAGALSGEFSASTEAHELRVFRDHLASPLAIGGDLLRRLLAFCYDRLTDGLERHVLSAYRRQLLAAASGRVLDVGAGTGANLPHYSRDQISELVLLEPAPAMLARALSQARRLGLEVRPVPGRAEQLPFADGSFDTVVFTLALCTVDDPAAALAEARRVLRPPGRLLLFEHVRAERPSLAGWQDRLAPPWRRLAGGCHLNRPTGELVEPAGFVYDSVALVRERRIPVPVLAQLLVGVAHLNDQTDPASARSASGFGSRAPGPRAGPTPAGTELRSRS